MEGLEQPSRHLPLQPLPPLSLSLSSSLLLVRLLKVHEAPRHTPFVLASLMEAYPSSPPVAPAGGRVSAPREDPIAILREVEEEIGRQAAAAWRRNQSERGSGLENEEEEEGEGEWEGVDGGVPLTAVGQAAGRANESGVPSRLLELRASRTQTSR